MKDIFIIGAGNFGREVAQLIKDINQDKKEWNLLGYIDETATKQGTLINNNPVLGGFEWIEKNQDKNLWAVCAIGNPKIKYSLLNRVAPYKINFGNLIHPNVIKNDFIEMGYGCIVCAGSFLSVNTKLGNFVSINPSCGIGHDTTIDDYTTLYWNVTLSGNVKILEGCEIGSKVAVIPQRTVGKWCIIGAGAVVVKDLPDNCTAVGVPAKPIKHTVEAARKCNFLM